MNKKITLKMPVTSAQYAVLIYLSMLYFYPEVIKPLMSFFKPFMGVVIILFTILATLIVAAFVISLVIIFVKTYTNKLDNKEKEPDVFEKPSSWKWLLDFVKTGYSIWLFYSMDYIYLSVIFSIYLVGIILFKYIQDDLSTKLLKQKLAWKEPSNI